MHDSLSILDLPDEQWRRRLDALLAQLPPSTPNEHAPSGDAAVDWLRTLPAPLLGDLAAAVAAPVQVTDDGHWRAVVVLRFYTAVARSSSSGLGRGQRRKSMAASPRGARALGVEGGSWASSASSRRHHSLSGRSRIESESVMRVLLPACAVSNVEVLVAGSAQRPVAPAHDGAAFGRLRGAGRRRSSEVRRAAAPLRVPGCQRASETSPAGACVGRTFPVRPLDRLSEDDYKARADETARITGHGGRGEGEVSIRAMSAGKE